MKAWQVSKLGMPTDVLQLVEIEKPKVEKGKVLIEVESVGMNFFEILLCQGKYQVKPMLPFVPGAEISGKIVETSENSKFKIGQKVLAQPQLPLGGFAEFTSVDEEFVFPIPDSMEWNDAATIFLTFQTSYYALVHRAGLKNGETLVVHAGAGGVGSAAVQIGKALGAKVIATAGGEEKVDVCLKMGADIGINYLEEDFVGIVNEVTDGKGADVIYDPVGGETYRKSTKCIAPEGRILVVGYTSGEIPELRTNHALIKNYSVVGVHWGYYRELQPHGIDGIHKKLMSLYNQGKIKPLIFTELPFKDVPKGFELISSRKSWGKIVVKPKL